MKYKTDFVREQFPAFGEPSLKRWAHFENAGGSYMASEVLARLQKYDAQNRVQPYYAYPASKEAGQMMDESYEVLAQILNVDEDWVHIGPSTTDHTYTLSQAFREIMQSGENIVVTNQDHEANSGYWRKLEAIGVEIREWGVRPDGLLAVEDLWPLIDDKTRFVAFPHVSNIIGQINPAPEICAELRARKVISIVDGVSYAPHIWPDLQEIGADIYFFSTYKTYGPHQGVMTIRPEIAQLLPNQSHSFNAADNRKRFNPAGPQHAAVASIAGLKPYLQAIHRKHFKEDAPLNETARNLSQLQRKHESKLLEPLLEEISALNAFRLVGSAQVEGRVPTLSLYHEEKRGVKLAKKLRNHGIMAAGGDFYAPRILHALGIDPNHGVLRLSFVHYTNMKEIEKLIKALKKRDD